MSDAGQTASPAIAIVDDDLSIRRALTRVLGLAGFEVKAFESGEALLREFDSDISCIIADVHLGGLSGPEVKAHLRQRGCELPLIFITADESECLRLSPCLKKPFLAANLIALIRQAMVANV